MDAKDGDEIQIEDYIHTIALYEQEVSQVICQQRKGVCQCTWNRIGQWESLSKKRPALDIPRSRFIAQVDYQLDVGRVEML
eukprot:scaffold114357_cov81-Cyclotella_meneghiniana.AAC.1